MHGAPNFWSTRTPALSWSSANFKNYLKHFWLNSVYEIYLYDCRLLFELLNDIREEISCLFPLCECLAELDVCLAFAHVGAAEGYVRPSFGDELRLSEARHPVLDATAKERIVANDVVRISLTIILLF